MEVRESAIKITRFHIAGLEMDFFTISGDGLKGYAAMSCKYEEF